MVPIKRDPESTRGVILEAAFNEIHEHGFQAASIDNIIAHTGVTKGALYHHFPNKQALGYAVIDELIAPRFAARWKVLIESNDPITIMQDYLSEAGCDEMLKQKINFGCPLNNLAQEMSPIDEGFRIRIERVFDGWRAAKIEAFKRGQAAGTVSADVDVEQIVNFLMASIEGAISLAKNAKSIELFQSCADAMSTYLESLRPSKKQETV